MTAEHNQLDSALEQLLKTMDLGHEGYVLVWFDGGKAHVTGSMSWKMIAARIPWAKLSDIINKEELASRLFGHLVSWFGRPFGGSQKEEDSEGGESAEEQGHRGY